MSTANGPQGPERRSTPAAEKRSPAAERRVTVIAPGTSFHGELTSSDPVEVHGSLEGDAHVTARFTVGESGRVFGNIDAAVLVVAGEVNAGMLTAEKIELRATARVTATLRARVVTIAEGALFEGDVDNRDAPGSTSGPGSGSG
jgi:cytoskeletal protein CcmA (bactofilin family)